MQPCVITGARLIHVRHQGFWDPIPQFFALQEAEPPGHFFTERLLAFQWFIPSLQRGQATKPSIRL